MEGDDGVSGPYDVMDYERELTDFLTSYRSEDELRSYPVWESVESTRKMVNHFIKGGKFEFTAPVRHVLLFGLLARKVKEIDIVAPDESLLKKETDEAFAERLLKEENPWEAAYELQVASYLADGEFKVELVEEGTIGGPDIYVHIDGQRIDIECKRRRPGNVRPLENEGSKKELQDQIFDNLGLETGEEGVPELSFYLEFTGDGPLVENAVDPLATSALDAIENKKPETVVQVGDVRYRILLKDYFYGERELEITADDLDSMMENFSERHIDMFLSQFDEPDLSPGMESKTPFYIDESGAIFSKGIQVVNHRFPDIDQDYYSRVVEGAISRGRDALSDRAPSVLFVYLPAYEYEDMHRATVEEYSGDEIPQVERLEQMIEGQLEQSSSLNAIIINTTYFRFKEGGGQFMTGFRTFGNPGPEVELPTKFKEYIELP